MKETLKTLKERKEELSSSIKSKQGQVRFLREQTESCEKHLKEYQAELDQITSLIKSLEEGGEPND